MAKEISVFVNNLRLSPVGIQLLVGLTTLLMVLRFALDYLRHRSISPYMRYILLMLDGFTYSLLHYSLGVMQRPSLENSYYQVWAVLLVTLRYSVKHGRPADVALKQTPLVDLMSSFWAAYILRSHAPRLLKIPVWLLWSINSARIIHGFVSSEHANANHRENVRLVTEYMRPKASPSASVDPATMAGYKCLVLGEAKQRKKVRPPRYSLERELTEEEKLISVDKIWAWSHDDKISAHGSRVAKLLNQDEGELMDLCLSFALYKLLRRRFFNLPIHESSLHETKQLIFDGIRDPASAPGVEAPPRPCFGLKTLYRKIFGVREDEGAGHDHGQSTDHHPVPNYKRALRIATVELSILNDFFFSRHALMFATGFPYLRLLLSTLLVGAISYMAVAIHRFSKTAKEDEPGRVHVRHGVVFTWILLTLLGVKEMIEIASYVLSDWTKVLLLCKYVRQRWWLRGSVMGMLVRLLCRWSPLVRRSDGKIGQYNLIFSRRRWRGFDVTYLAEHMQEPIFVSLRRLRNQSDMQRPSDKPYVDRALLLLARGKFERMDALETTITNVLKECQGEVHMILLWHIATCYCNDIIIAAVLEEVTRETCQDLRGCFSISQTFEKLKAMVDPQVSTGKEANQDEQGSTTKEANDAGKQRTLLKMRSELGHKLMETTNGNDEVLWEFLAELWAGYVLHLAESTRASKHKIYLSTGGDLLTHLWALLSDAGLMGSVEHGEMGNGEVQAINEVQRQSIDVNTN